jgi:predicted PurR-regulated permease PerM
VERWLRTPFPSALATAVFAIAALYFAEPVLAPLAIAGFLSVVLGGAVQRVERFGFGRVRLGRIASVVVVAIGISAGFVGIGWIIANEGGELAEGLPQYRRSLLVKLREPIDRFEDTARQMRDMAASEPEDAPRQVEIVGRDSELVSFIGSWAGSVASLVATAGIVVVLLIFLLIERDSLRDRVLRVAGRGELRLTGSTLREASERVARYLRALALLNCAHGVAVGVGLALLGLPGALLFGLLAAALRFIPFLGPLIAACAPLALSIAVFDDWTMVLWVGLFLGSLEVLSNNFFEPWLYGASVGLSPFAVILSAIFWAWLWGPLGLVLATPLTVCLVVMGRHVPGLETLAILLGNSEALQPFEKLYERLLARDLESATLLIAKQNGELNAVETWDGTLIPALRLLERDRLTHELEGEDLAYAREAFELWIGELPEPAAPEPGVARGLPVVCVPTGAFADEIVSAALARLLEGRGIEARSTVRLLTSELVEMLAADCAALVCLSALDSHAAPVRHLVKRLQASCPGLMIVVGFWGEDATRVSQLRESLSGNPGVELITTLEAAAELLAGRAALRPQLAVRAAG